MFVFDDEVAHVMDHGLQHGFLSGLVLQTQLGVGFRHLIVAFEGLCSAHPVQFLQFSLFHLRLYVLNLIK